MTSKTYIDPDTFKTVAAPLPWTDARTWQSAIAQVKAHTYELRPRALEVVVKLPQWDTQVIQNENITLFGTYASLLFFFEAGNDIERCPPNTRNRIIQVPAIASGAYPLRVADPKKLGSVLPHPWEERYAEWLVRGGESPLHDTTRTSPTYLIQVYSEPVHHAGYGTYVGWGVPYLIQNVPKLTVG